MPPSPTPPTRQALARATLTLALALTPAFGAAETFVHFGDQPDGSVIFVQKAPASVRADGKLQGWFRTVPKAPAPVTDEFGFQRRYHDMLALNVADCFNRRMGVAMLTYRNDKDETVARFDAAAGAIEFRDVKPGTLAESMLEWLCSPRPRSAPPPPLVGGQSPFK